MAYVQSNSNVDYPGASMALAFDSNVTAGSCVCGWVLWGSTDVTLNSVGDGTRTFTLANNPVAIAGVYRGALFYYPNHPGGATTVTATCSGDPGPIWLIISEHSGRATSSVLTDSTLVEQVNPEHVDPDDDCVTSGAITVADGDELIGFMSGFGEAVTIAAGTNFTRRENDTTNKHYSEDRIISGAGTAAATFTDTGAAFYTCAVAAMSLKPASGGASIGGALNVHVRKAL